jgi:predicted HicB family RNase H-like nuclease
MKTKKQTKKAYFSTNLRIDSDLAKKVKASAEAAKRSMNKEIEFTLEKQYQ